MFLPDWSSQRNLLVFRTVSSPGNQKSPWVYLDWSMLTYDGSILCRFRKRNRGTISGYSPRYLSHFTFIIRPALNAMVTVVRIQLQPFLHEHLECRTIETSPTVQMNCLITLVCS